MNVVVTIVACLLSAIAILVSVLCKKEITQDKKEAKEKEKKENEKTAKQIAQIKEANAKLDTKPNDVGFNNALELLQKFSTKHNNKL